MSRFYAAARRLPALLALIGCSRAPNISARDAADANDVGGTLVAKSENERALLRELPSLQSGIASNVGGAAVIAEEPYTSASGRTCRALRIGAGNGAAQGRLACTDGKVWFFVPGVFGDSGN